MEEFKLQMYKIWTKKVDFLKGQTFKVGADEGKVLQNKYEKLVT